MQPKPITYEILTIGFSTLFYHLVMGSYLTKAVVKVF